MTRSISELRASCRALLGAMEARLQKQQPPPTTDGSTPAYDELRTRGLARWRSGLAVTAWQGMGQAAGDDETLYLAYEEEVRQGRHDQKTAITKEKVMPNTSGSAEQQILGLAEAYQQDKGGSLGDAIGAIAKQHPELWERRRHEQRPVRKAAQPAAAPLTVSHPQGVKKDRDGVPLSWEEQVAYWKAHPEERVKYQQHFATGGRG